MLKKLLTMFLLLFIIGFSFFYTNKAVLFARKSDPIMMKIMDYKDDYKIDVINPIINNDEYVYGMNGCVIDEEESYNKMKSLGSFDENLIVMKEEKVNIETENKYIIGGNKENKNIGLIFIVKEEIDEQLLKFIKDKNIKIDFFVDGYFLENNLEYIEKLSKYGNVFNFGRNKKYLDKYISYDNNLIKSIANNESNYCLTDKKDSDILNICNKRNMEVIKSKYLKENILTYLKYNISNGKIIVIDNINDNSLYIKVSINYIMSKGYNIISINKLLQTSKSCDIIHQR